MTGLPALRTTRRGAVGGLLAAIGTAGCDARERRERPPGRPPGSEQPAADPDSALVDTVVSEVAEVAGVVAAAGRASRALRDELRPWRRLHLAHLAALEAEPDLRPARVRGSAAELNSLVRRREATLQRRLADGSVAARSGPLASLLATMSAAVAQQLAAGDREGR